MTVLWLICFLCSNCPDFIHQREHQAWIITLVVCLLIDFGGKIFR